MKKKQKIGLLGGTFDPVHKGHLALATAVLDRYRLDRIVFIPAPAPPHKHHRLTQYSYRVAMLEAVLDRERNMEVSLIEAERPRPSYTFDTLTELHRRLDAARFFLIMGADMFVEIRQWYRYQDLFSLADIIVVSRPGIADNSVGEEIERLPGRYQYHADDSMWQHSDGSRIYTFTGLDIAVSSSQVRQALSRREPVDNYLARPVIEYIRNNGLYAPMKEEGE